MEKKRSIQENMLFNTVGSLIYYVCQWMMTVFVVKLSGMEDAGVLSLAMSLTAAPAIIGLFNMRSYQVSDVKGEFSDRLYLQSRVYTNALSLVICFAMIIFYGYTMQKASVILVFMLSKVVEGFVDVYYGIDQKWERLDYAGISMALRGIGGLVSFILGLAVGHSLLLGVFLMTLFSAVVVLFYDRKKVKNLSDAKKEEGQTKERNGQLRCLLVTCLPLAVVAFLNNLSLNLPKLELEQVFGSTVMGIYNSIASPTIVIQLAATTIFAPLIPMLSLQYEKGQKKEMMRVLRRFSLLAAGLTVVCLGTVKILEKTGVLSWILVRLFDKKVEDAVPLFFWIVVLSVLIAVNACLFSLCTLLRAIKLQYVIGIVGVAVSYLVTKILISEYEMQGTIAAIAATLLAQIVIQMILIVRRLASMHCSLEGEKEGESK